MKQEHSYGAVVERGEIVSVSSDAYTVRSLDRSGIIPLPTTTIGLETYSVGDIVYFFVFGDGTGRILSKVEQSAKIVPDGSITAEKLDGDVPAWVKDEIEALTQSDIVNDTTTDDTTKVASAAVAKALNSLIGNLVITQEYTGMLVNGALVGLACPANVNFTDYRLPIILANYFSVTADHPASSTAHSYTVQQSGNSNFNLYARDGTAVATGYVNIIAFFIHK